MLFELNCGYHLCIFYKEDLNLRSKSKTAEELFSKLQNVIAVYQQNLYYTQKLQKQALNKKVKSQNFTLDDKIWLNS